MSSIGFRTSFCGTTATVVGPDGEDWLRLEVHPEAPMRAQLIAHLLTLAHEDGSLDRVEAMSSMCRGVTTDELKRSLRVGVSLRQLIVSLYERPHVELRPPMERGCV